MSDNPTIQIFDDIEGLSWWESHEDLNKLYVGLVGLSYATEDREISHFVRKIRLPFEDIKGSMSAYLKNSKKKNYNPKLTHKLYENVHPSLVESAKTLERLFILFDGTVESLLAKYGVDIQHQELGKISHKKSQKQFMIIKSKISLKNDIFIKVFTIFDFGL